MPGAGGTQRTPRLIGVRGAAELTLTGKHVSAQAALDLGLVDKVVTDDDVVTAGLAYVRELLAADT